MGHSSLKETQVYAKIVNEELDKAMDVFNWLQWLDIIFQIRHLKIL
jgi:hypothetical protein